MGAPLKNPSLAALQSRSRFCEGSMNDRISAAPPVHFLGPDAIAAVEQPVPLNNQRSGHDGARNNSGSADKGSSQTWSRKTGSRLFGQVWEGVRGKLRLRKDDEAKAATTPAAAISAATTTTAVTTANITADGTAAAASAHIDIYTDPADRVNRATADGPASRTRSKVAATTSPIPIPGASATTAAGFKFTGFDTDRPSKDQVLASYQQLMAEGFFKAHATHASRQCLARPPGVAGASLPSSMSAVGMRPATARGDFHRQPQLPESPPQWPLASPREQHLQGPFQSPTSVSSRGTKRAAMNDEQDAETDHEDNNDRAADADGDDFMSGDFDKENQAPPHPNTVKPKEDEQPKKRLRRVPSRDSSLFMPKIRSSSSSRRSLSTSNAVPSSSPHTGNKLQKRRPGPLVTTRGLFDLPSKYQQQQQQQQQQQGGHAVRPRHVSDGGGAARVLRGRLAEEHRSMRVVPDAERGIPSVPAIPPEFTFGKDHQGDKPWRGLRIR